MRDVCIIGGGPAGLNAALILGRCARNVLVLDSGKPRNGVSRALHGFLTRDGTPPLELRELGPDRISGEDLAHATALSVLDRVTRTSPDIRRGSR